MWPKSKAVGGDSGSLKNQWSPIFPNFATSGPRIWDRPRKRRKWLLHRKTPHRNLPFLVGFAQCVVFVRTRADRARRAVRQARAMRGFRTIPRGRCTSRGAPGPRSAWFSHDSARPAHVPRCARLAQRVLSYNSSRRAHVSRRTLFMLRKMVLKLAVQNLTNSSSQTLLKFICLGS